MLATDSVTRAMADLKEYRSLLGITDAISQIHEQLNLSRRHEAFTASFPTEMEAHSLADTFLSAERKQLAAMHGLTDRMGTLIGANSLGTLAESLSRHQATASAAFARYVTPDTTIAASAFSVATALGKLPKLDDTYAALVDRLGLGRLDREIERLQRQIGTSSLGTLAGDLRRYEETAAAAIGHITAETAMLDALRAGALETTAAAAIGRLPHLDNAFAMFEKLGLGQLHREIEQLQGRIGAMPAGVLTEREWIDTWRSLAGGLDLAAIRVGDNGQLTAYGEPVDFAAVGPELEAVFDEGASLAAFLSAVETRVKSLNPYVGAIVLFVVLQLITPYLVNVVSNLHTPFWDTLLRPRPAEPAREVVKEIRAEVRARVSPNDLREWRFVKIGVLAVRANPKMHAPRVDELELGTVVKLVRREKSWSAIEYRDPASGDTRIGWVLSRYLARYS